jgi:hypothetical protein
LGTRDEARALPDDAKGAPKLLVVLLCVSTASADTLDATLDATAVAVTQSDDYDTSPTLGEDATSEMVVYNRSSSTAVFTALAAPAERGAGFDFVDHELRFAGGYALTAARK